MKNKFEFSEEDKKIVREAVESLEKDSSGEMVVYFARSSDDYRMACWKLSTFLGVITAVVLGVMSFLWMLPDDLTILHVALMTLSSSAIGFFIAYYLPSVRLGFVNDGIIQHRVLTKARDMFLQEQVFDTIDRTGILIYISEMEHMVQVIGDEGINQKIDPNTWSQVVELVINGIKNNNPAQGISDAIYKCKSLLLENGFVVREDDKNELSDDMRIED